MPGTAVALHAAIAYCRKRDAELGLVGVVRTGLIGRWRHTGPEKLAGYEGVARSLELAADVARHAGLCPTVTIRAGDPRRELVAEARATGASGLFVARMRSWLAASIAGRPRFDVEGIELAAHGSLIEESITTSQVREKGASG
jgi:hypothetical protein